MEAPLSKEPKTELGIDPAQRLFPFAFNRPFEQSTAPVQEAAAYAAELIERCVKRKHAQQVEIPQVEQRIIDFVNTLCAPYLTAKASLQCTHPDGITLWVDKAEALRHLCFPPHASSYETSILKSYRVWSREQGFSVLHNPTNDRRTTERVNHVVDYGFPVPRDKISVPIEAFAKMWERALNPPREQAIIPFTAHSPGKDGAARDGIPGMTKILLHPVVVPEVPGIQDARKGEVLFVAPGGATIANLDFVSQVFGLAGDPLDLANDLSWQGEKGTGLTSCIIVAPHLVGIKSKELGLPHRDNATPRQIEDKVFWTNEDDQYNGGKPFKLTLRSASGEVVTIIADNYFGYNKKEVMTELSYECNRIGCSEVEHSGGAELARCANLGREYVPHPNVLKDVPTLFEIRNKFPETMDPRPEGHAVDRRFPSQIVYVPKTSRFSRDEGKVIWSAEVDESGRVLTPAGEIPLKPDVRYTAPNGFTVSLTREVVDGHEHTMLVGRVPDTILFHKPSTVSGGGKSELGKTIKALVRTEPFSLKNPDADLAFAEKLCGPEGIDLIQNHRRDGKKDSRGILDRRRTVGSVIKLLTPSREHSEAYNLWLDENVPAYMRDFICLVKHHLPPGVKVQDLFFTPLRDGERSPYLRMRTPNGGSVAVDNQLLRVGWDTKGQVRYFGRRAGNASDQKLPLLDDITVSTIVPAHKVAALGITAPEKTVSLKFVHNCEQRLFQRPDDAAEPGADPYTEKLFATDRFGFFVNYEPLTKREVQAIVNNGELLSRFHPDMQDAMRNFLESHYEFFASTSSPRIVDGVRTKNPRFLQIRPDVADPVAYYHSDIATRLCHGIAEPDGNASGHKQRNPFPRWVNINVPAHRVAPEDTKLQIPTTAIWGVLHRLGGAAAVAKLICTFTPKSRATTGFGDEGALTKGPFNFMPPAFDINAAVISMILTDTPTFVTAAGFIGPQFEMDHDITYLAPGILARMKPDELDSEFLYRDGYLESVDDIFEGDNRISAAILGGRVTDRWVRHFGGRVCLHPEAIFPPEMLRPELQNREQFREGLRALWRAYGAAAERWKRDGSYELAIPPVQRTIDLMLEGPSGEGFGDPDLDKMFTKEALLAEGSYYYRFLEARRQQELQHLERTLARQEELLGLRRLSSSQLGAVFRAKQETEQRMRIVAQGDYIRNNLMGTTGTDPGILAAK